MNRVKIEGEPLHTQEIKTPQFAWRSQDYAHGGDKPVHIIIHVSGISDTLSHDAPSTRA